MPLEPIPADPRPTAAELASYLPRVATCPERIRKPFAALLWSVDKKKEQLDLFQVPFTHEVPNYTDYLNSFKWAKISRAAKDAADGKCRACPAKAQEVHHRDYRPRVLEGHDPNALVPLCISCHKKIERVKKKESWNAADRLLMKMVAENEGRPL